MTGALPKDFATFAPEIIEHAAADDPVAVELLQVAGAHVDALAQALVRLGADRLSWSAALPHRSSLAGQGDASPPRRAPRRRGRGCAAIGP
jgi:N-acetylglucosamine kinase-like BadF-type ATPase